MKALSECLSPLGVTDLLDQAKVLGVKGMPVLVGCGTDGASVNWGFEVDCKLLIPGLRGLGVMPIFLN